MVPAVVPVSILCSKRLFREALCRRLGCQAEVELVDSAATACELARSTRTRPGEMILLLCLRDSTSAAKTVWDVKTQLPRARLIVLGLGQSESEIVFCIEAGASFCLDCRSSWAQLLETILAVWEGRIYGCSPGMLSSVARRIGELARSREASPEIEPAQLTTREKQIAGLISLGLADKQIARRLGISVATARTHIHNLMAKTQLTRRCDVLQLGLLKRAEDEVTTAGQGRSYYPHDAHQARRRLSTERP